MREVAAETGGKTYMNQNEIRLGVALAAADDKGSYAIGYYPENKKWDGKYRSIKVKVAHGDTEVRYRKGYFASDSSQEENANYEQNVATALTFNTPATGGIVYGPSQVNGARQGPCRLSCRRAHAHR